MPPLRQQMLMTTVTTRSNRQGRARFAHLVLMSVLATNTVAVAQKQREPSKPDSHDHGPVTGSTSHTQAKPGAVAHIPDVEVLDQDGKTRRFYTDLVKGRVVIMNFIYTTCTAFCPMSGSNFSRLQALLGDRLGRDVHLISVTTDPVTDSPAKLKAWGERFKAKSGWTLVTGNKNEMTDLLRVLTGDGPSTGYHVGSVAIVNDLKGNRRRVYGLETPERLIRLTDELAQRPPLDR